LNSMSVMNGPILVLFNSLSVTFPSRLFCIVMKYE
jgi:hypothetical protein